MSCVPTQPAQRRPGCAWQRNTPTAPFANNRLLVEGRAIIGFAKAWRIDRGSGEIAQQSLAQLCEIVDLFNAQDLELKRPRADLYAATMLAEGTRYFDRQRPSKKNGVNK
jgi:hypothetical protein